MGKTLMVYWQSVKDNWDLIDLAEALDFAEQQVMRCTQDLDEYLTIPAERKNQSLAMKRKLASDRYARLQYALAQADKTLDIVKRLSLSQAVTDEELQDFAVGYLELEDIDPDADLESISVEATDTSLDGDMSGKLSDSALDDEFLSI